MIYVVAIHVHTLNKSFCRNQFCVWHISFDLIITENLKSDASSQPDDKEEDEELFSPGNRQVFMKALQ